MRKRLVAALSIAALSFTLSGAVLADSDPSVHQIYEAAASGQLVRAQEMMDEVLRDHPTSSKAHFVQSELYARQGKLAEARSELGRAEQLSPGLPKENPRSVAALRAQLGTAVQSGEFTGSERAAAPRLPWTWLIIGALVIFALWRMLRRRPAYVPPGAMPQGPAPPYGPSGPMGGGMGSTIAGGLAGGLAAGAGIVAGEEIAHHLLDGDRRPEAGGSGANSDMGGNDFGIDDPGSWDDGSAGGDSGGGGGDGWT